MICARCCQEASERRLCGSGRGDDQVKEGCKQALCIRSSHELCAHGHEEPAGSFAGGRFPTEEHRSDEGLQSLVQIPEIQATMWELSKEMMKARLIEEMLEDSFESMDDEEEIEEAAEMEINKILFEITARALGKALSKVNDALPEPEPPGATAASEDEEEEEDALEALQSWLATLCS